MAQYKVPQDVEADDKLLGPFSFRQFVYLLIAAGLIALAVLFFQIFPLLALIPAPFILLLGALALPIKKDQPMETYLAAIISYHIKPRTRIWFPGQRESTILITAPKVVEASRTRDISGEEATHRLSFLANVVDSGGHSVADISNGPMRDDLAAEASTATDMFEDHHFDSLRSTIKQDEEERHAEMIEEMRAAIKKNDEFMIPGLAAKKQAEVHPVAQPPQPVATPAPQPVQATPSQTNLANNQDFSVATIAKEANRIRKDQGEIYVSLH